MSPKMTPKEAAVWDKFRGAMNRIMENEHQSIGTRIEQLAVEKPKELALFYQDKSWTWQTFNEECNRISNFFLELGLKRGDSVALMLENCPEYFFFVAGINKIQGISALINFNQRKQALTHSFNVAESKWIVVDGECLQFFNDIIDTLPHTPDQIFVINNPKMVKHNYIELSDKLKSISNQNPKTTFDSILRETALYIYTSGTTGLPKAVIMQNFRLYTQASILCAIADLQPDDIIYIPTPLYHNVGIGCSWMKANLLGAKIALSKRFSASEFWNDIRKFQASYFMYVGEIPRYLLNQPRSDYEKNHTLKKMLGLGLRKEIWEEFQERFGVDHIYEFYGSTEGHRPLFNVDEIPGMVGRDNMAGFSLAKVDPETGEFYKNEKGYYVKCKPGDVGMGLIKVEERGVFTGYKDREKTEKKLLQNVFRKNDCYFNTGDLMKVHEDLWVSFVDRLGDTFRWKGENVSTLEVEAILNSHPTIQMSSVYGVAIPNTEGKAGMAAIKLDPAIKFNLDEFSQFILDVLPKYSIPIYIRIIKKVETTTSSFKIIKTTLCKEGYDIDKIKDTIYFWDSGAKNYVPFTDSIYWEIKQGKFGEMKPNIPISM
ncbi:MAG: long-chain-acyl-CoA synthetase [Promethearchaeota archaeon]|nr:MAG: long-chain-acyl-CoA synthetase [Candidatus Lokiarchaeota archaeon]